MTMKVFDLACHADHGFEGWFGSADAFDEQARRKLIACPLCGSTTVRKLLSAPRLNLGAAAPSGGPAAGNRRRDSGRSGASRNDGTRERGGERDERRGRQGEARGRQPDRSTRSSSSACSSRWRAS